MIQKTGTSPKPYFINPLSVGTVTNLLVPKTHEQSRADASQLILLGNSETLISSAMPPDPTSCQSSSNPQMLQSTASFDIISQFNALEKQIEDDFSRQKSLFSSLNCTPFL